MEACLPIAVWRDSSRLWLNISISPGDEFFEGVVLRGLADGKMKLRIGFNSGLPSTDPFSCFSRMPFIRSNISFSCSFGRQSCDVRFDELAQLKNIG